MAVHGARLPDKPLLWDDSLAFTSRAVEPPNTSKYIQRKTYYVYIIHIYIYTYLYAFSCLEKKTVNFKTARIKKIRVTNQFQAAGIANGRSLE